MVSFTVKQVKSLLQHDLVTDLEKIKANIIAKIKQLSLFSQSKLYEHLTVSKTVHRDWLVKRDITDNLVGKSLHQGKVVILYFII